VGSRAGVVNTDVAVVAALFLLYMTVLSVKAVVREHRKLNQILADFEEEK
jgi:hypothetical protein